AKLELSRKELSAVARRGATSAARSITGEFSHLRSDRYDASCVAEPIENSFDEDIRIVVGLVSQYKQTSRAHRETPQSHLFRGRLAYIHGALAEMREAIHNGDFESAF